MNKEKVILKSIIEGKQYWDYHTLVYAFEVKGDWNVFYIEVTYPQEAKLLEQRLAAQYGCPELPLDEVIDTIIATEFELEVQQEGRHYLFPPVTKQPTVTQDNTCYPFD